MTMAICRNCDISPLLNRLLYFIAGRNLEADSNCIFTNGQLVTHRAEQFVVIGGAFHAVFDEFHSFDGVAV